MNPPLTDVEYAETRRALSGALTDALDRAQSAKTLTQEPAGWVVIATTPTGKRIVYGKVHRTPQSARRVAQEQDDLAPGWTHRAHPLGGAL